MRVGLDLFWPAYAAVAFMLAAVTAQVIAYRRTSPPVSTSVRYFLLSLRIVAVGLLVFVLWRPAIEKESAVERKGRLVLLVDRSRSMSIGDETSGATATPVSRLQRAAGVFSENAAAWRQITDGCDVEAYSFAAAASPLPVPADALASRATFGVRPDGQVTALGDALRQAEASTAAPQAILVVSDGLSNSGADPLDTALAGSPPIYAVSVGSAEPTASTRDVAATGIFAPSEAFRDSEVRVLGQFSLTGLAGRSVTVNFRVNGRVVDSKQVVADSAGEVVEASFDYKPETAGPAAIEVAAEPLGDEIVAVNNSASTYIDVKEGGLRVLYVEGGFRWEAKFLRAALESLRATEVRLVIPGGDGQLAKALDAGWDVLILGSVPASALPPGAAERIADAVSTGGKGLVFLGGPEGLASGGYGSSALAPLCPFEISSGEEFEEGLLAPEPRPAGPHASIVDLGADFIAAQWRALPPLLAYNAVGPARPGASVLLVGQPRLRDEATGVVQEAAGGEVGLLAVEDYGKGRTGAFTGSGTWQWVMGTGIQDAAEREKTATAHRRFWRNLVFWLGKRDQRGEVTVDLDLPRHRVALGESIEMDARVLDAEGEPITDAHLTMAVATNGREETRTFWLEGSTYRALFEPERAGKYGVRVTASRAGEKLAEAKTAFEVTATDIEFTTLVSRPSLLAAMALATGGKYAAADNARHMFSDIVAKLKRSRYVRLERRELWSSSFYLALIIAFLALEWAVRKFAGLA